MNIFFPLFLKFFFNPPKKLRNPAHACAHVTELNNFQSRGSLPACSSLKTALPAKISVTELSWMVGSLVNIFTSFYTAVGMLHYVSTTLSQSNVYNKSFAVNTDGDTRPLTTNFP